MLPFAAGLHSLELSGRLSVSDLNEDQIRLAVTILYTLPRQFVDPDSMDGSGTYRPEWFRTLLDTDPALVADVLCRAAIGKLETGVQLATELRELRDAEDHREVAGLATLPVLKRRRRRIPAGGDGCGGAGVVLVASRGPGRSRLDRSRPRS